MKIEMRKLSEIKPYDNNPRINDAAVAAVARSIQEFGWRVPIVCDEQMVILAGHTRYKAAIQLGLQEVPVHVAVGLTPAQAKAFRLADNKSAELSTWDYDLLPIELAELQWHELRSGHSRLRPGRTGETAQPRRDGWSLRSR